MLLEHFCNMEMLSQEMDLQKTKHWQYFRQQDLENHPSHLACFACVKVMTTAQMQVDSFLLGLKYYVKVILLQLMTDVCHCSL